MTKRTIALALAALVAGVSPSSAWLAQKGGTAATPTTQIFVSQGMAYNSDSADSFYPLNYTAAPVASDGPFTVAPYGLTIKKLTVRIQPYPPTGIQTWVITVRKNGSDTALTCTVDNSADNCAFTTDIVFAAGDYGSIKAHPNNTPTIAKPQFSLLVQPTTANDVMLSGFGNTFSDSVTQGQVPGTSYPPGALANRRFSSFNTGGNVDKLYVASNAPSAAADGKKYNYTLDKNGSVSAVTCEILETATSCNDTTHGPIAVTGASGTTKSDDIEIQAVPTSTPAAAAAGWSFRYLSSVAARFPWPFTWGLASQADATTTYYCPMTGADQACIDTESHMQSRVLASTVNSIAVTLSDAPGAAASGKKRNFTLRVNGSDTACTVELLETVTANTASCNVSLSDGNLVATSMVPTNSPAYTTPTISYSMSVP